MTDGHPLTVARFVRPAAISPSTTSGPYSMDKMLRMLPEMAGEFVSRIDNLGLVSYWRVLALGIQT